MVILEPSTTNVVIALGIVRIPIYARIVRGSVLSVKTLTYIEAAKALAVHEPRLLWRHILPNCMAPIIVTSTLSVGNVDHCRSLAELPGTRDTAPHAELGLGLESRSDDPGN